MDLRHVVVEADGAIVRVHLSGGALCLAEARELEQIFDDVAEHRQVRVVVIDSVGADFCTGAGDDLDPLSAGVEPVAALARVPQPVVVALRGRTHSVGLELALAADIRIAHADTTMSMSDVSEGRLPCWGGTQRLPRLGGRGLATMMILAGASVDADAAARAGVVHRVVDDLASSTAEIVDQLVALAPLALSAAKEALATGPELPMRQALELEGDLNHLLQTTADRAEGLSAFFEKRTASFEGT